MKIFFVMLMSLAFSADAWVDRWAPEFKAEPAKVKKLPAKSVDLFVDEVDAEAGELVKQYSLGGALDLNGDGIDDFVFIIPWMGCGLNASGHTAHFIVSDGAKGRKENVLKGYEMRLSDLVVVGGKTYFRHSAHFEHFEKSEHNHWVYQVFSFGTNGVMKSANAEVGSPFPAATIFYDKPKFKQIEFTAADMKAVEKGTRPVSRRYAPWEKKE